jgi:ribosomal protein L12E/L44/L45/RPP1/RPP2
MIPFTEVGMFAGGGMAPPGGGFVPSPAAAPSGKNIHAKGDLLKNRVSSIMQGVEDDDDEEEEEEKPKKKKFFGLFG